MYVCLCHGVTDRDIREAVCQGASRLRDLSRDLGVGTQCGKCACYANMVLKDALKENAEMLGEAA